MRSPMRGLGAVLVCVSLVLGACGGRDDASGRDSDRPAGALRSVALADPVPAVPAFVVELREPVPDGVRLEVERLPDVAIAAAVASETMRVEGPAASLRLRVGSTRPLRFRSVAPASTKEADFVWTSLLGGSAVVTRDTASALGIESSGQIQIRGRTIPVGAFASNGTPDVVDLLVPDHIGRDLGMGAATLWVIGGRPARPLTDMKEQLERSLSAYDVRIRRVIPEGPAPLDAADQPEPTGSAEGGAIGSMPFRILEDGFIQPDDAWVRANIATGEVALLGTVTCHRLVFPQLHAAMTEIAEEGLADQVDPNDYGGCYVPRFIDRDPDKPLSMHAFGLAFDINVSTNHLGTRGDQHPRVVEILERWGFEWGGRWARPDPMHFELVRLIQT